MKQTLTTFILVLFVPLYLLGQDNGRGYTAKATKTKTGVKRALVVGISEYKETSLKLNYSDDDALIFKAYLEEVEKIPQERLMTLISNDSLQTLPETQPTSANILRELKKIMDETQEGDTVYFYFAGHGDVVDDQGFEEGFLLAADTNDKQEYYGTPGVISLKHLNSVITNVTDKGAKFILVLDACRSGFLYKEGTQKNLETFNNNFQHSTKFFSCGPNQLSYESKDLGHGYFTYYLVLGMLGAADNLIQDNSLQYFELATFLDGKVKNETNQKQAPIVWHQNTVGVFKAVDTKDKELALKNLQGVSSIKDIWASRSLDDFKKESVTKNPIVKQFNKALKKENFSGNDSSAYQIFKRAETEKQVNGTVLRKMRNGLINALSTNAQILINSYIGNAQELPRSSVFKTKAHYLELCLELLQKDDFIYDRILMSKLFLEAYSIIRARHYSKYPIAKSKLKEALQIEDRAAYIHNALGIVLNHENNYKEADFHYKKAKSLIPSWSFPVNNMGSNYYEQYQYGDAKKYLDEALTMIGSKGDAYNNLGAMSEGQGKYSEAESYYHKVKEVDGEYSVTTLRNLGALYKNKGNIKKAIEWYDMAFKKDSTNVYSYYDYSQILNDNNLDNKRAEKLLIKAIELEPFFSRGYAEYADLLRRYPRNKNSYKTADSLYTFAIKNDPFYEWSYAGKGWLYHKQNLKTEALSSFNKAIEVNPKKPKSYYYLANYYKSGLKDFDKAEELYLKAIELDSFYLPAFENLVDLYNKNNEEAKSLTILNNLINWNTDAPDIWNLLGNTHFDVKDYSKAVKAYQKAIDIDSTYAKGFTNLGFSLMKTGAYNEASNAFKKATRFNPFKNNLESFSVALVTEGRNKNRAGNYEEALTIFEQAFNLSANYDTATALAELLYFNENSVKAFETTKSVDINEISKTRKIKFLELACKVAIDINLEQESKAYYESLKAINPSPNYILEALINNASGNNETAKELLSKANPLMLKEQFLSKKFNATAINIIKQIQND